MKALIFDFDGVIVDSEDYWPVAINHHFKTIIPTWKNEDNAVITGMNFRDIHTFLQKEFGLEMPMNEYEELCDVIGNSVYEQCNLVPGVLELVELLKENNITMAITSSSKTKWIQMGLKNRISSDYFAHIVSNDITPPGKGKPDPFPYLETARLLSISPSDAVVIEDSVNGIRSAKAANMYCIGYRAQHNAAFDLSAADRIIKSYEEIPVSFLRGL